MDTPSAPVVEPAIRQHIRSGAVLHTPAQHKPFTVQAIDRQGVVLLLGAQEAHTRLTWACLEGLVPFLSGRGWVPIGSRYDTVGAPDTLDGYLKAHMRRATAGWVAALLEEADLVQIDRGRPARVRLKAR